MKASRLVWSLVLLAFAGGGIGKRLWERTQAERVAWVLFTEEAARSDAPAAISAEALQRRIEGKIPPLPNDAPIPDALIKKVEATGATIRERSRWLRAVSVSASPSALRKLNRMREVATLRPVGQLERTSSTQTLTPGFLSLTPRPLPPPAERAARAALDSAHYGPNWTAIRSLGVPPAHELGFDGSGVRIAILDTGFETQHEAVASRAVVAQRDFINNDDIVANEATDTSDFDQERHGTQVWSILGGFQPGIVVGTAPGAYFLLAKIDEEPGDTKVDEDRWVAAVEWADSLNARIISSSVAFRYRYIDRPPIPYDSLNGDLTVMTRHADEAARRNILLVQAMGDAPTTGPGTLAAPADADSIIAVGAVDTLGNPASFSARGPTFDGRTKPELVAGGTALTGASSPSGNVGYDIGLSGTSFSTALVAGGAAMFMQAWPEFNAMAVRRALQLAGSNATTPNNTTGWGIPDIGAAILFPEGISPAPIIPRDVTGSSASLAPTLSWATPFINSEMRPIRYRVDIATDATFANIIYTDTVTEASSLMLHRALPGGARLFWRVTATTPGGVTRTSFADQIRMPEWVRLVTLAGDQVTFTNTTQPELEWQPLASPSPIGPLTYEVHILANETGAIVQRITNLSANSVRVPEQLTPNQDYRWRVIVRTNTGQVDTVASTQPFVVTTDDRPPATILYQNFPNPFPRLDLGSTDTRIWFDLAESGIVSLTVHDTRGRLVKRLIPARGCQPVSLSAGIYGRTGQVLPDQNCALLRWDATDDNGEKVAGGIYILRLQTASNPPLTKKMIYAPNR